MKKAIIVFLIVYFSLLKPCVLFSGGRSKDIGPTPQERYNALAVPGIVMLPVSGISAISPDVLFQVENELAIQLVDDARLRPVRMQNWLLSSYVNKASNPFVIMNDIRAGNYTLPLHYLAKPFLFKSGRQYYFILYVYPLTTYYPITIFRRFSSLKTMDDMIASCIEELHIRISEPVSRVKKRVVIDDFSLEFYRLVKLRSGELEFISTPFIERDRIALREGDDFFSRVMGYILETTNLFQVIQLGDFREYSNFNIGRASNLADYRIQGRVQISDYECVLYVNVMEIRSGTQLISLRHPLVSYSFDEVWKAYRQISVQIIERLFDNETFNIIPPLAAAGLNFFYNNMFIGQNVLDNFILERGLHIISTGSRFRVDSSGRSANTFYILSDNQVAVFKDIEGRHIWNLLSK